MKHAAIPGADGTTILKIAILAVGGQGGGVLTGWITALAEAQGWWAQATSVAGVAQRTGATIYYVEMAPKDLARPGRAPVFALSPAPGDVDVLVAAELAEAGRAVLRGFVTERTTLIASTHRQLAVSEKVAPGDGRADAPTILAHAGRHAGRLVAFDMEAVARASGAHVSAALLGALAASGALPFPRAAFEATIRASGRGVEASLGAFAAAHDEGAGSGPGIGAAEVGIARPAPIAGATPPDPDTQCSPTVEGAGPAVPPAPTGPARLLRAWEVLARRLDAYPPEVAAIAAHGLAKVVDFLDPAYGGEYLDRLEQALAGDAPPHDFSRAAAKHLANAMAYDDLPRVADLKLRAARARRIRAEAGAREGEPVEILDYFHPRMAEAVASLPAAFGAWLVARPALVARLDRFVDRGRRLRTDRAAGALALAVVAALRPHRRRLLRHRAETAHLDRWFALALAVRDADPALGAEILNARRLIKGYADTHARGLSKFDRVLGALPLLEGRPDAAPWMRRLIAAALQDPEGRALDGAIATVESFAAPTPGAPGTMNRSQEPPS